MITVTGEPDIPAVVTQAIQASNGLLSDAAFFADIAQHPSFDLSTAPPAEVARILQDSTLTFRVEMFYPGIFGRLGKYRKTLAYTDSRYPNTLFLNVKKLNRSAESIAATIIHEGVHAADDAETQYTFGHGNNSPVGKDNTAPYWIGNHAYERLTGAPPAVALVFDQPTDDADATTGLAENDDSRRLAVPEGLPASAAA